MRPRSISIYVKPPCQPEDSTPEPTTGSASGSKRAYSTEEFLKMFEDFGPIEETHVKDAFSGDFQCCPFESTDSCCSTTDQSISPQMTLSQLSSKSRSEDVLDEDPKVNKIFRGMIIGAKGTGKQALVNSMFSSFDEQEEARQGFDLITRRVETEESIERYHFWLKDAWTENNRRHESVMSVYYKTCSAFFLIYNTEDRTSFDCLEQEIKLIKEANTNKEVRLVLIGNKRPEAKQRQVTSEEARCFKEKFNVQMFLEVEISFEMLDELREAIQDLAK